MARSRFKGPSTKPASANGEFPLSGVAESEEAMRFLKMGRTTLYKHCKNKTIPATKIGGQWKFTWEGLRQAVGML